MGITSWWESGPLRQLHGNRVVPARSTLYRHRLTLHMSFLSVISEVNEELLQSPGGCTSWRTLDLSPHAGIEYVLHGATIVQQSKLAEAFSLYLDVVTRSANEKESAKKLSGILIMRQGCPVGVGSGRKGLRHKMHACMHAERLLACSWKSAGHLINCTITFVGDLGEGSTVRFKADMRLYLGDHIVQADQSDAMEPYSFQQRSQLIIHRLRFGSQCVSPKWR